MTKEKTKEQIVLTQEVFYNSPQQKYDIFIKLTDRYYYKKC